MGSDCICCGMCGESSLVPVRYLYLNRLHMPFHLKPLAAATNTPQHYCSNVQESSQAKGNSKRYRECIHPALLIIRKDLR